MKPERTWNCNLHLPMTTTSLNRSGPPHQTKTRFSFPRWATGALLAALLGLPMPVHASMFKGEALDTAADVLTWVVLIVAPLTGIAVFLLVHILPEKIAEKKQHPQAGAIQCLCLLSLVFGGRGGPLRLRDVVVISTCRLQFQV